MSIPGPPGLPLAVAPVMAQTPTESLLGIINSNPFLIGSSMLMMNLGARYLPQELSRGQETFFQHPWVRRVILFIVLFMGTRNIMIAGAMWVVVVALIGYLLNENSAFCVFGSSKAPATTCSGQGVVSGFTDLPSAVSASNITADRTVITGPAPSAAPPPTAIKNTEEPFVPCPQGLTKEEEEILAKLSKKVTTLQTGIESSMEMNPVVAAPPSPVVVSLPYVEPGQNGPMSSRPGEAAAGWGAGSIPSARIYDVNAGIVGAYTL